MSLVWLLSGWTCGAGLVRNSCLIQFKRALNYSTQELCANWTPALKTFGPQLCSPPVAACIAWAGAVTREVRHAVGPVAFAGPEQKQRPAAPGTARLGGCGRRRGRTCLQQVMQRNCAACLQQALLLLSLAQLRSC
jgi:hypothetical protein